MNNPASSVLRRRAEPFHCHQQSPETNLLS